MGQEKKDDAEERTLNLTERARWLHRALYNCILALV
jgi:hypothetical protein